jgi:hypothetical protein
MSDTTREIPKSHRGTGFPLFCVCPVSFRRYRQGSWRKTITLIDWVKTCNGLICSVDSAVLILLQRLVRDGCSSFFLRRI